MVEFNIDDGSGSKLTHCTNKTSLMLRLFSVLSCVVLLSSCEGQVLSPENDPGVDYGIVFPVIYDCPRWHPSGDRISYHHYGITALDTIRDGAEVYIQQRWDENIDGIWMIGADGHDPHLVIENGWEHDWSPDGGRITFNRGYCTALYIADADGGNEESIDLRTRNLDPSWSDDGDRIARTQFDANGSDYFLIVTDVTTGDELRFDLLCTSKDWIWSQILFTDDGIQSIDINSRIVTTVIDGAELSCKTVQVSPDGSRIAFQGGNELYVADADGSGRRVLSPSGGTQPAWSPDGSMIVYVKMLPGNPYDSRNNVLWLIDVETGDERQLTASPIVD